MSDGLTMGIVLGAVSAAAANMGVVVEKVAMRRMPRFNVRKSTHMIRTLAGNPLWLVGFAIIAAGLVMQVLALTLASISIVQAVSPIGTILLLVASHFAFGDRLGRYEYAGITALILALGLLALSLDPKSDQATGATGLSGLLIVSIPTVIGAFGLFFLADWIRGSDRRRDQLRAPLYGLATGLLYGAASLDMKAVSTIVQHWGLVRSIPHVLDAPATYLFIVTSITGFFMFQMSLQRTITSVLVPVSGVFSTAYFILIGNALFHEHLPSAAFPLAMRLSSFAVLAVGLGALAIVKEVELEHPTISDPVAAEAPLTDSAGVEVGPHVLAPRVPGAPYPDAFGEAFD
jgi:drug/metabolite transporter (DMT)-like permease